MSDRFETMSSKWRYINNLTFLSFPVPTSSFSLVTAHCLNYAKTDYMQYGYKTFSA